MQIIIYNTLSYLKNTKSYACDFIADTVVIPYAECIAVINDMAKQVISDEIALTQANDRVKELEETIEKLRSNVENSDNLEDIVSLYVKQQHENSANQAYFDYRLCSKHFTNGFNYRNGEVARLRLYSKPLTGETIKGYRLKKGLTLRQIEDATGVSNAYLSQLENGKINNPSHTTAIKILDFILYGNTVEKSQYLSTLQPPTI